MKEGKLNSSNIKSVYNSFFPFSINNQKSINNNNDVVKAWQQDLFNTDMKRAGISCTLQQRDMSCRDQKRVSEEKKIFVRYRARDDFGWIDI